MPSAVFFRTLSSPGDIAFFFLMGIVGDVKLPHLYSHPFPVLSAFLLCLNFEGRCQNSLLDFVVVSNLLFSLYILYCCIPITKVYVSSILFNEGHAKLYCLSVSWPFIKTQLLLLLSSSLCVRALLCTELRVCLLCVPDFSCGCWGLS